MTEKTSRNEANGEPPEGQLLQRFLRDWTELWREEWQALANDPEGVKLATLLNGAMSPEMPAMLETWRAAMVAWAGTMGVAPAPATASRDPAASPGTQAAVAASDARDAEIERLARRVDELEARLARLETPRRPTRRHSG